MVSGTTALVVEDEYIIALEVQRILEAAGGAAVIAAPGLAEAIAPDGETTFDLAIVAVPPDSPEKVALCRSLSDRGISVVVLLSSPQDDRTDLEGFARVVKPFPDYELLAAAKAALQRTKPCDPVS